MRNYEFAFKKRRSGRNWSVFGGLVLHFLLLSISYLVLSSEWINWWVRGLSAAASLIVLVSLLRLFWIFIFNPIVEFSISDSGICYGDLRLKWENIAQIYARGGLTIFGTRRYQIGYVIIDGVQFSSLLPVDGGISKSEVDYIHHYLENIVCLRYPHINIKMGSR